MQYSLEKVILENLKCFNSCQLFVASFISFFGSKQCQPVFTSLQIFPICLEEKFPSKSFPPNLKRKGCQANASPTSIYEDTVKSVIVGFMKQNHSKQNLSFNVQTTSSANRVVLHSILLVSNYFGCQSRFCSFYSCICAKLCDSHPKKFRVQSVTPNDFF